MPKINYKEERIEKPKVIYTKQELYAFQKELGLDEVGTEITSENGAKVKEIEDNYFHYSKGINPDLYPEQRNKLDQLYKMLGRKEYAQRMESEKLVDNFKI